MLREVARLHMARKELADAGRLLDEVAAIQQRIPGLALSDHAETLRTRGKLAVLNGSPEEAARDYEFALTLFYKALPLEGGRSVHTLIDLGNAFLGIDRLDEAALAYERAILLQGRNDADPQWGRARNNLGIVKMRRKEWKEAARLMGEALPNVERSLDESNFELGEFLVTYAEVLREVGDPRAHAFGARGLAIYEKTIPANDPRTVDARSLVAALMR
jgi:tetratricopeptide (TPR) repeat protein